METIVYIPRIYNVKHNPSTNTKVYDCFFLVINRAIFEPFSLGKELTNLMLMTRHTNRKKCPATKRLQKPNEKQMVKKKLRPEEPPPLV